MSDSFLNAEEIDERAHQLYNAGDYDAALAVLRDGLARYPDVADLHVGLGYVRLAREEFAWAYDAFQTALGLDSEHEDGWVGMGESLLKFGRRDEADRCFARVDALGAGDDPELGLAIGRALYREGMLAESRERLARVMAANADDAEVRAALAYTLHALGEERAARRQLRFALRLDPELHEVRIYLAHLLFERGELEAALREMERVPAAEHWDPLSLWRFIELKCSLHGCGEDDESLAPWKSRWRELQADPDPVDHLLAEVEERFDEEQRAARVPLALLPPPRDDGARHRVRTVDGRVYTGSWEEIVRRMRDEAAGPEEPLHSFMQEAARRVRSQTGHELPCDDPETFLRESARIGLIRIER